MTLLTTTSSLVGCWKGDATTSAFLCLKVILSKGGWLDRTTSLVSSFVQFFLVITQDYLCHSKCFSKIQRKEHCWMSFSWTLSILPKLLASVHGYGWLYRLLFWLYFSLGQILYLRLPYQGWTLSWWSWVLYKGRLVTHLLVRQGLLNPNGMKEGFFCCCCLLHQQLTLVWLCNKGY